MTLHRKEQSISQSVILPLILLILGGTFWNFWLPTAEDYLNLRTRPEYPPNIDFFAYYNAGNRFSDGANPYYWADTDPAAGNYSDFIYPPSALPMFEVLGKLDYTTARYLWFGISMMLFLAAFLAARSAVPRQDQLVYLLAGGLFTLTSYPLLLHIRNGQMDLAMISLILVSLMLYHRRRILPAALLLAAATVVKVSPGFLLIYFLLYRRDYRFTSFVSGGVLLFVFLSLLRVPLDLYLDYAQNILPEVSRGTAYWLNQSIVKVLPEGSILGSVVSLLGLGLFSGFTWLTGKSKPLSARGETQSFTLLDFTYFYLNLLVILAFAGKIWSMAYVWMIVPSALLLTLLLRQDTNPGILVPVVLCILLMNAKVYGFPLLDSLNLLGNLLITGILVYLAAVNRLQPTTM